MKNIFIKPALHIIYLLISDIVISCVLAIKHHVWILVLFTNSRFTIIFYIGFEDFEHQFFQKLNQI